MAEIAVGALQWARYSADVPDLVAPYLCDFTQAATFRFSPRGTLLATPGTVTGATGVLIDNMQNGADALVTVGPIVEFVPRYQKVVVPLVGAYSADVVLTGTAGQTRAVFFTGAYHGVASNINAYASNKASAVATITDGNADVFFNTLRWKINYNLAAGFNLDNIVQSGYYDVLNPTSPASGALAAGTWYIEHHTYSSSNLYAFQVARNLLSPATAIFERRLLGGSGWTVWVDVNNYANAARAQAFTAAQIAQLAANSGFLFTDDIAGYEKLPDGRIDQWGYYGGGLPNPTIGFPLTFPSNCRGVLFTPVYPIGAGEIITTVLAAVPNQSGFTASSRYAAGGSIVNYSANFYWRAWGR